MPLVTEQEQTPLQEETRTEYQEPVAPKESPKNEAPKNDPLAVIDWVANNVAKLRLSSIVQETIESAVDSDVAEHITAARDKFSKLMATHTELSAKLFFLKQLRIGSFGRAVEMASHRELIEAKGDLESQLERDEFAKSAIHAIADDLETELGKVMELREEYRLLVEQLEVQEAERKERRGLKHLYEETAGEESTLKAKIGAVEDSIAATRAEVRRCAEEEVRLTEEREALRGEAATLKEYKDSLEWYEALTGMLGGLGGIAIAPGGLTENTITFVVLEPLPEQAETKFNCKSSVKLTFNEEHTALTQAEAKTWSQAELPHNDLSLHAVKTNDWQFFLREYRFRALNVVRTEQEVFWMSGPNSELTLTLIGGLLDVWTAPGRIQRNEECHPERLRAPVSS